MEIEMRKLVMCMCALAVSFTAFGKSHPRPKKEKFDCKVEVGDLEAKMKFENKDKGRKPDQKFEAKLEVPVGQGLNANDVIAVAVDGAAVGSFALKGGDDEDDDLEGKLKLKNGDVPAVKAGSVGTFTEPNGTVLTCTFVAKGKA
jgi:hypothetical protein